MVDRKWRNVRGGAAAAAPSPLLGCILAARILLAAELRSRWQGDLPLDGIAAEMALALVGAAAARDLTLTAARLRRAQWHVVRALGHEHEVVELIAAAHRAIERELDRADDEWVWGGGARAVTS